MEGIEYNVEVLEKNLVSASEHLKSAEKLVELTKLEFANIKHHSIMREKELFEVVKDRELEIKRLLSLITTLQSRIALATASLTPDQNRSSRLSESSSSTESPVTWN